VFRRLTASVNETIVKPRVAAAVSRKTILKPRLAAYDQYVYVGFSRRKIPRSIPYTTAEKAIRFRHPNYDRAQKLITSSISRCLSTRNISSISMYAFLSNLANRQTDRQTDKREKTHLPPSLSEVKIQDDDGLHTEFRICQYLWDRLRRTTVRWL